MSISSALLKVAGVATISGGIVLGSLVMFQGTDTIDVAKEKITEFAERINIYEQNENILVSEISKLKDERDLLLSQLEQVEGKDEALELRIQELEAQIIDLEEQLLNADSNADQLAERILQLEAEVTKANEETAELQTVIDETVVDAEPMTEEEIAGLTGKPITNFTYTWLDDATEIVPGITISSQNSYSYIQVTNNTEEEIKVIFKPDKSVSMVEPGSTGHNSIRTVENITIEDSEGNLIAYIDIIK